jgi:hypothetical protein
MTFENILSPNNFRELFLLIGRERTEVLLKAHYRSV